MIGAHYCGKCLEFSGQLNTESIDDVFFMLNICRNYIENFKFFLHSRPEHCSDITVKGGASIKHKTYKNALIHYKCIQKNDLYKYFLGIKNNEVGWKDGLVVKSVYGLPHNLNSFPGPHQAVYKP